LIPLGERKSKQSNNRRSRGKARFLVIFSFSEKMFKTCLTLQERKGTDEICTAFGLSGVMRCQCFGNCLAFSNNDWLNV